jgi:hypothetical protein
MLRLVTEIEEECPSGEAGEGTDPAGAAILLALNTGGNPIIVVHPEKSVRSHFLDELYPALLQDSLRPIRVMSPNDRSFDLATLMQQIVGLECSDPTERLELCHAALTTLPPDQQRIVLIIDDAHLLTEDSLRYLDLMVSVAGASRVPLQLTLVGGPAIWANLPQTGALAADNVACRVTLEDQSEGPLDGPSAEVITPSQGSEAPSGEAPSGEAPSDAVAADSSPGVEPHVEDTVNVVTMVRAARPVPAEASSRSSIFGGFALAASFASVIMSGVLLVGVLIHNAVSPGPATEISAADVPAQPKPEVTAATDAVPSPAAAVAVIVNGGGLGLTERPATQAPPWIEVPQAEAGSGTPLPDAVVGPQLKSSVAASLAAASVARATEGVGEGSRPGYAAAAAAGSATPPVTAATTPAPAGVTPVIATIAEPGPSVPPTPGTAPAMAPEVVAALITRGDELLSIGDVTAARLMYSRAAESASADGATGMAMTFDPNILPQLGVQGLQADPGQATIWYQRAANLGSSEARQLLKQLRDGAAE